MAHNPYDLMMSLALDGELGEREQEELQLHLQVCAPCADAWQHMRWIDAMFTRPSYATPPVNLTAQVMARIEAYERSRRSQPWAIAAFTLITLAAAVSIAAPVLFFALGLHHNLLTLPLVGNILGFMLRVLATLQGSVELALNALRNWLAYLVDDPAVLAVVLAALVLASTSIGLLEWYKTVKGEYAIQKA